MLHARLAFQLHSDLAEMQDAGHIGSEIRTNLDTMAPSINFCLARFKQNR